MGTTLSANRRLNAYFPDYCETHPRLTEKRIRLVRESWTSVHDGAGAPLKTHNDTAREQNLPVSSAVVFFYDNFFGSLFEFDSDFHQFFGQDMEKQGRMLFNMIGRCIEMVESHNIKGLKKNLSVLAKRHQGYGVEAPHYSTVGLALLVGLSKTLGKELFTDETRDAWIHLYSALMILILPHVI